jgi:hypothetical protein
MTNLNITRRNEIRDLIRYCKDEDELRKVVIILSKETNSLYTMEYIKSQIIPETPSIEDIYFKIIDILKYYCDLKEEYYSLIALWIIGTYVHKEFYTYPFIFINAVKGSGKSRLLKLISVLSYNGEYINNINEAVMFRTAKDSTFCIDEFESIAGKEKAALRELLNGAYKKGMKVKRAKKVTGKLGEKFDIETFELFCPVAMANIWGMDNVLEDRCISLILEKSNKSNITNKIEMFEYDHSIIDIKQALSVVMKLHFCNILNEILHQWNPNIDQITTLTTLTTYNTLTTHTALTTLNQEIRHYEFFSKIINSKVSGRYLELYFPLYMISYNISLELFEKVIEISKSLIKEKKAEEVLENKDISILDFLVQSKLKDEYNLNYITVTELTSKFKEFLKEDEQENKWMNSKWIGRALKRLNLIKEKRRIGKGIEVIINFTKAREKLKIFKDIDDIKPDIKTGLGFTECQGCMGKSPPFVLDEKGLCELCQDNKEEEIVEK